MEKEVGQYYDTQLGVGAMSADQLDTIALERAGMVGGIGFGFATRGQAGLLAGGWTAMWINTKGMGNHGQMVLVPTDRRTRAIARQGKERLFMLAGLTRQQAERLYCAEARYKYELLPVLAAVLACKGQTRALLAHPGYGPGAGRAQWERAWEAVFPTGGLGLSAPREAELAKMVRAVAGC